MRVARPARLTLFVALSISSAVPAGSAEADSTACEALIELIRNDPTAASLAAADWWCHDFVLLRHPPDDFTKEAAELEEFLISFVRTSTDDWLVDRIASSMADCSEEAWSPLFFDLLDHPSPQLRWRAIQHFAYVEGSDAVPALEALWDDELPPWIRADLAYALLENESFRHAEDCVDLVDAEDLELARAALWTLEAAQPPGALESIRRLAEQDDSPLREDAVSALAAWADDTKVMRLLVSLSCSESGAIQDAALSALADFAQPEAIGRLVEVASDTTVGVMPRLTALGSVADSDHPDLIRVLSKILDEPTTDDTIRLQQVAYEGLSRLGVEAPDPASLPREFTTSFTLLCSLAFDSVGTILPPVVVSIHS